VLSAIIFHELLQPGGTFDLSLGNPRLLAGALAALVVWRTKNVFLAITAGMLAFWLLQTLRAHSSCPSPLRRVAAGQQCAVAFAP
jgi:branched-subunit amino acid transport protein